MQMMGVIWFILQSDTNNPEHLGKIADYAETTNFRINLAIDRDAGCITANVMAWPQFDA
jgi:hypothetical protein